MQGHARKVLPILVGMSSGLLLAIALAQTTREAIEVVGSATVYPFTVMVAEQISRGGTFAAPQIESTGTGKGFKLFCNGVGAEHPDIVNASRQIKSVERDVCARNGVKDIIEIKIGYDGVILVSNRKSGALKLTRRDVYLALAQRVPDAGAPEKLIANPHETWEQVNPSLPDRAIEFIGPPESAGTRDAFAELVLEPGCDSFPWIKMLKAAEPERYQRLCHTLREDGAYSDAGDDYDLIARKIESSANAIGIVGYSFLKGHTDTLIGGMLEGFGPTLETISTGRYPASRALYIYAKKARIGVVPGLKEFIAAYVTAATAGPQSDLAKRGLIPLHEDETHRVRADALAMKTL